MSLTHKEFMRRCIEETKTCGNLNTAGGAELLLTMFADHLDASSGGGGGSGLLENEPVYAEHEDVSIGIYSQGYGSLPYEFLPVEGEKYAVTLDGTTYECTATVVDIDGEDVLVVGNTTYFGGNDNSDIPVAIVSRSGRATVYANDSGEHTIGVAGNVQNPQKIPREYLDLNPVVGVIDSHYYNFRYLNPARGASIAEVRKAAKEKNRDIVIRLDLDNWQGTLRYLGLINATVDGNANTPVLLFSTIKGDNVSVDIDGDTVTGKMQFEYWYALLEPTEGPPSDAFVNCQFAEINLTPGTSRAGYYMQVNEDGQWEAVDGLIVSSSTEGSNKRFKITVDDSGALSATEV